MLRLWIPFTATVTPHVKRYGCRKSYSWEIALAMNEKRFS